MGVRREVGLFDAKTRLSELVQEVEAGESWTITRRGKPVARLLPALHHPERASALRRLRRLRQEIQVNGTGVTIEELQQWRTEGQR